MVVRIRKGARAHLYVTEWREYRGLTLKQLAERVGVEENTIWRWEKEQHRLNPEKQALLAHHLDIESRDLHRPPPGPHDRPSLDRMLEGAPDDVFDMAADLVKRLTRRAN